MKIKKEKYDYYYSNSTVIKKTSACGLTWFLEKNKFSYLFPIITICYLLTENGIVGRGVSICSKQDTYNEIEGKKLAKNHALRAIKGRHLDNFKRPEVIKLLIQTKCPFTKKGERNPVLSWWERKFLFGAKNMDKYDYGIGWDVFRFIVDKTTIPPFDMPILKMGERIIPKKDIEDHLEKVTVDALRKFTINARNQWFEKNIYSKLIHQPKLSYGEQTLPTNEHINQETLESCKVALRCISRLTPFAEGDESYAMLKTITAAGRYADDTRIKLRTAIKNAEQKLFKGQS